MKSRKQIVPTIDEYFDFIGKTGKTNMTQKDIVKERYAKSLSEAQGNNDQVDKTIENLKLNVGKFSLRTKIKNNKWVKDGKPASSALKWLHQEVLKNPGTYQYRKRFMESGGLFYFEYMNPKYKNTARLPWFDKYPLVISLGPVSTNQGVRNLGFNLHLVPPAIRVIAICTIFEMYKRYIRFQLFYGTNGPVKVNYKDIIRTTHKFGLGFSIRMYIPQRQRVLIKFPFSDWHKAIFIPSRGYDGIKAQALIREWKTYQRNLGNSSAHTLNWKSLI